MKNLLLLSVFIFLASCSSKDATLVPDPELAILREINLEPEINAKVIDQLNFKKIELKMTLGLGNNAATSNIIYDFEYEVNGKLKTVKENNKNFMNIIYKTNEIDIDIDNLKTSYQINKDNVINNTSTGESKYYYKNGYLLRNIIGRNELKKTYSSTGNLLNYEDSSDKGVYEYYDYPNNIRQEILRPTATHWSFRDTFFGKFSTNLIKKISFNNKTTLTIKYEFDNQNRVSKMIVDRIIEQNELASGKFEYSFSY